MATAAASPQLADQIAAEANAEYTAKLGHAPTPGVTDGMWRAIYARLAEATSRLGAVPPMHEIDLETDARFWAHTGYRPGQPLRAGNALDAKMVPAWNATHTSVENEWKAGTIRWTYNSPEVAGLLAKAKQHSDGAAASLTQAKATRDAGDHATAAQHVADAHAQIGAAQVATAQAATAMPPPPPGTHPYVQQAAHEVLSFTMNGAGQGVLTGETGGPAGVGLAPDDQVAAVQTVLAPTRTAPVVGDPGDPGAPDSGSQTLPGGKGHNAIIIAGICAALLGGVAIANLSATRSRGGSTLRMRRAR